MSRAKVYSSSSVNVWTCLFSARSFRSSEGFREPTSGGVIVRVGAMNFAMRAIRRPNFGMASASRRENLATAWNVSSSSPREKRYRPSGRGRKLDSCGMTSKPCEGRSRSRMICGRRRLHTYEQTVNLNPGYTSSVTAAPPRTCRRSRTTTFLPAWARYAAVVRPLWPPPGDGVLRDPPLRGTARRLAALQVPDQREGCPSPREQGRHPRCVETREGTDLLHAMVR